MGTWRALARAETEEQTLDRGQNECHVLGFARMSQLSDVIGDIVTATEREHDTSRGSGMRHIRSVVVLQRLSVASVL